MRAHSIHLLTLALAFTALSPHAVEAQGIFSFGRSLAELSGPDREAMTRARMEVLEKRQEGAVSAWSDKDTGHSGEVDLRRTYEKNSMPCGDVEYVLKRPETWRFRASFCRGGDGIWRAEG